ncbi:MAG TPA: hypothetical protein VHC39_05405 [Rhizomicrobium sp.]|nr:hypothetical protein [Rhizomicrobium sp.]
MTNVYTRTRHCEVLPNRLVVLRQTYVKAAMTRPGRAVSKPAPHRRWVTLLALLAFFLQGLAVQTHVHELLPVAKIAAQSAPAKSPLKSQDPVDQCRLCHELVHAGTFVTPSAAASPVGLTYVSVLFVTLTKPLAETATAFAWQSRAPPRR